MWWKVTKGAEESYVFVDVRMCMSVIICCIIKYYFRAILQFYISQDTWADFHVLTICSGLALCMLFASSVT